MTLATRGAALGYALAFTGVTGLVLLHGYAGLPHSADVLFLAFLCTITLAGWVGGFGPALLGTLLASLLSAAFALPPERSFALESIADQGRLLVLMGTGALIALLARWGHDRGRLALAEAERVRASEERFRLAARAVQGVLYDLDPASGLFWASEGLERVIGAPPQPAGQRHEWWLSRMHPDDRTRMLSEIARLTDGPAPTWSGRYRVRHEDGHWVHVWDSARLLRDAEGRLTRVVGYSMDVSSEVAAAASLRASEERLRLAIEALGLAYWDFDLKSGELAWSESHFELFGCDPQRDGPARMELWRQCVHPDDLDRVVKGVGAAMTAGTPYNTTYRIRRHDTGEERMLTALGRTLSGDDGQPSRFVGVVFDISEQAAAQEVLRQRVEESERLLEVLPAAVWYARDAECRVVTANAQAARITVPAEGVNVSEWMPESQRGWRRLLENGRELAPDETPLRRAVAEGRPLEMEFAIERADGAVIDMLGGAAPLFDAAGRVRGAVAAFVDITGRKQAERALVEARRLFEEIANTTPGVIYLFDLVERRNVYASRGLQTVLGYAPDEVQAMGDAMSERLLHPDDLVAPDHDAGLVEGQAREHEIRMRHADGSFRWLRCRETLFSREADGRPRLMLGIAHDVTEEKATLEALRASESRLRFSLGTARAMAFDWVPPDGPIRAIGQLPVGRPTAEYLDIADALQTVHPDDRELVAHRIGAALAGPGDEYLSEHRLVGATDEHPAWVMVRGHITRDADGRPTHMAGVLVDISARRMAEDAVRATQENLASTLALLDTFIEHAPVAMAFVDRDLRYLRVNSLGVAYSGVPLDELLGRTVAEVSPELWPVIEPLYRRALETGEAVVGIELEGPASHRRHGEPPRAFLASYYPVRTDAGEILGVGLMVDDITARKQAETRLRASEQRLRELADAMPQIVFVNRADGGIEFVNRQWEFLTGEPFTSDAAVHERVHPDDRAPMLDGWLAAREGGEPYVMEFRLQLADGSYRWFLSRAVPVCDEHGAVLRWYGTSTDIDAQKRTQARLQQAEARQRTLADAALRINASLSVAQPLEATLQLVVDLARGILGAHQGLLSAMREGEGGPVVHAVSLGDKYASWRGYDEPISGTGIYAAVCRTNRPMRLTQAQLEAHPLFTRFRDARQEHPPLRGWLAVPLVGRDGRNLGVLQFSDRADGGDFSAEDEAVAMQMAAMASVAMENWSLVQQIRETDRRKDEFLATLAHELRNPLAPIGNSIELLRQSAPESAVIAAARETMERQMQHLVHLVDDLLDASRITSGKLTLRREPVPLTTVLLQAAETARPALERAGQTLDLRLPPSAAWLDADPTRLTQVFANLLNNAAKFGAPAGVVTVDAVLEDGEAVVRVRDRGIGIPPEKLGLIFEMFSQVDRGPDRSAGGLGIGLALVRRLVEMHGGRVDAASAGEGQGSTFTVRLPLVDPPSAEQPLAPADGTRAPGRRILIADDNRDSADSMAALLAITGHETRAVYDGAEAVEAAERWHPDVALLDLGMPRLDGHEAARRIRDCLGPRVLLVAMTGWGDDLSRQRTRESGFDAHLTKPVELPKLIALLAGQ